MSFLAPLGLLLGLLTLPLLGLYFLKIRRKRVTVPSILLWEELVKAERMARPFDRFRQNLLLWLQLLLLLLVVLAFARPAVNAAVGPSRSLVLVVDTSASMGATDVRPNRLAVAVDEALATVSGMGPADEATVVVAGPRTEVAVPFTRETGRLRDGLNGLAPSQARSDLRDGMQLALSLARSRPGVEVLVYSDGGQTSLADLPAGDTPVHWVKVGRNSGNTGILAVDLRTSPSSELERQAFVTVQRFGGDPVEATVQVFLNEKLVGLRNATAGDKPISMVFDLPPGTAGQLRVELDADDDHLETDDTAWAVVQPVRKRRILLVGGDALTRKVLGSDPRVDLKSVRARALTRDELENADAVFVTEPVAEDLTGFNVAWLGSDTGGPASLGGTVRTPEVLGWRRTHPLMRFVAWDGVLVAQSHAVADAANLTPLVDSTGGPLVLAGERSGGRVMQLAFDPLKTDLPLRVAWPVLVLNAVGWLTEDSAGIDHGNVVSTGAPWIRRVDSDVSLADIRVQAPGDTDVPVSLADSLLRVQDTTRTGVYDVRIQGHRVRFAANLQAPEESDLTPAPSLDLGAAEQGGVARASVAGQHELWRYLLLFGLAVLAVEWLAWTRRRSA